MKDLDLPKPQALKLYSTDNCIEIEALTRFPYKLILLVFFAGFILSALFSMGVASYSNRSFFWYIWSAFFFLASMISIILFLKAIFGRIYITVSQDKIFIKIVLGPIRIKRRVDISKGFRIYKYGSSLESDTDDFVICLIGDKRIYFGTHLSEEQIDYIVLVIGKTGRRLGLFY
jgi:hypothetical protein